ncbi:unnamed protein product, partial [Adineta steineri]
EKQCEDIRNYVDMIDNLRSVVYKNIRELAGTPTCQTINDNLSPSPSTAIHHERTQPTEASNNHHPYQPPQQHQHQQSSGEEDDGENPNKTFMNKIRGTTKKTIQHAEEGLNKLDGVIKQLRTNMQKK